MLMIWMTIPAKALTYGTFLNISLASFAIFNTVSAMFVVVDATQSELVVDVVIIAAGNEGTTGSPWATVVIHEACNTTDCSGSIVAKQSLNVEDMSGRTSYCGGLVQRGTSCTCHEPEAIDARWTYLCIITRGRILSCVMLFGTRLRTRDGHLRKIDIQRRDILSLPSNLSKSPV